MTFVAVMAIVGNTNGQSYKASTSINYHSRVVPNNKLLLFMTRGIDYDHRDFIRLTTDWILLGL